MGTHEVLLKPIARDGAIDAAGIELPEEAQAICAQASKRHDTIPWQAPWLHYLAFAEGACVGTCAFVRPPTKGEVEIAYFTFPAYEGRGVATAMAKEMIALAREADPRVQIIAHTLPKPGPSTSILTRLGFAQTGFAHDPDEGQVWEWRLR